MPQYGVQRLVLINSGNYGYAEVDLTNTVHLAAPNNRGKSTLVNALQFLYINSMRNMKFPNNDEETSRHYFGKSPSYLIFECSTPIGIKCLLIRGLSLLRGANFERYIFNGGYIQNDFVNSDGLVREFVEVQAAMADRHFKKVPNNVLWKALAGEALGKQDASGGLKVLPIRSLEDYRNFCRVYRRLLTLADLDSDSLRDLLISCHSRDVGENRIDIATDYRDEFERAERTGLELDFIESAESMIKEGRNALGAIKKLTSNLSQQIPEIWNRAKLCTAQLQTTQHYSERRLVEINGKLDQAEVKNRELWKKEGAFGITLCNAQNAVQELTKEIEQWSTYSDEMIDAMHKNKSAMEDDIRQLESELSDAATVDLSSLELQFDTAIRRFEKDQRAAQQPDRTFATFLLNRGFSTVELRELFQFLNPSAHSDIIGEDLTIHDEKQLINRIRHVLGQIQDGYYRDAVLDVDLTQHETLETDGILTPKVQAQRIKLRSEEVERLKRLLKTAREQEPARKNCEAKRAQLDSLTNELNDYDQFQDRLKTLPSLKAAEAAAQKEVDNVEAKLTEQEQLIESLDTERESVTKISEKCGKAIEAIRQGFNAFHREMGDADFSADLIPSESGDPATDSKLEDFEKLLAYANNIATEAVQLAADAKLIADEKSKLENIEKKISARSQEFAGQQVYFADAEDDWETLIEQVESVDQMRDTTNKAWDGLFTTLSGRLDGLLRGVNEIQKAVQRLNSSLQHFQVSNLQSVTLKASTDGDTYNVITELCRQDGMFQNRDELESAKKQLKNWITGGKELTLDSLFTLRISGKQSDGSPIRANSLDKIGSTGTGITIKAMILTNLIRAIVPDSNYHLHFFIDETGRLDDQNLSATIQMAVSQTIIPITAEPKIKLESLAHPKVTVYTLDQDANQQFRICSRRSFRAKRREIEESKQETDD